MRRRQLLTTALAATGSAVLLPAMSGCAGPSLGTAPEFEGIDGWLNTGTPVSLAGLRGKVVLVNFWTYSCINCIRTIPYLNRWQAEYSAAGMQVVGIHTPEFGFERLRHNVMAAVREFGIRYPVGQDNAWQTWRGWSTRAWPTFHLLDRDGRTVLLREGEGFAHELERGIRGQLGLATAGTVRWPSDDPDLSRIGSPEIYFGALHQTPQEPQQSPRSGEATYTFSTAGPRLNRYELEGNWLRAGEELTLRTGRGGLRLRFFAAKLHIVASAPQPVRLKIRLNGADTQPIAVSRPTLYTLVDGSSYREHLVEVESDGPGLTLFSATFG